MPTYYLEVEKIEAQSRFMCRFLLSWGKNQRLPVVAIAYSESLATSYSEWQSAYLNYYRNVALGESLRGRVQGSGSFSPSTVDWYEKLRESEERLLREFNFWLRSPELYELWEEIKRSARLISTQSAKSTSAHIDLLITCSEELSCLPWEVWKLQDEFASLDTVRIARTVYSNIELSIPQYHRRPRLLAIFGDETGLDFQHDRIAMQILSGLAEIHTICWDANTADRINQKQKICDAIADEQGWDILFFTGHSDQTDFTVGKLLIAPNSSLTMSDIEPYLQQAKKRGLQIAIFNSCNGTAIASWSISKVGIPQAIAMREPIHNQAAQSFLVQFLKNLAQYQDAHTSMLGACRYLQESRLLLPSVYLIPSLFRHPDAQLFQLLPTGWKSILRRIAPNPLQAIALSSLLAISCIPSLQEWMLDSRVWLQAIYRQQTQRIPQASPPVLLVQIDEASLQKAAIADPSPMDRQYLAKLVDRLVSQKAQIIGIDYLLDRSHRNLKDGKDNGQSDRILGQSLQNGINQKDGAWFVLASVYSEGNWLETLPEIASKNGTVDGHIHMSVQYLPLVQSDVPKLPFAYLLAGLHRVRQTQNLRSPLTPDASLFSQVSDRLSIYGKTFRNLLSPTAQMQPVTNFAQDAIAQSWLHPIVDFSIPPDRIYQTIPAWQLLQDNPQILDSQNDSQFENQIVIISANYSEAGVFKQGEDSFAQPAAIRYWLQQSALTKQRETYTGGEVQAYAVHHFLRDRYVVPIPDSWMILLSLFSGAILVGFWQPRSRRQVYILLSMSFSIYTLASIEIYISGGLLLPIVFPAIAAIVYCVPKFMKPS